MGVFGLCKTGICRDTLNIFWGLLPIFSEERICGPFYSLFGCRCCNIFFRGALLSFFSISLSLKYFLLVGLC